MKNENRIRKKKLKNENRKTKIKKRKSKNEKSKYENRIRKSKIEKRKSKFEIRKSIIENRKTKNQKPLHDVPFLCQINHVLALVSNQRRNPQFQPATSLVHDVINHGRYPLFIAQGHPNCKIEVKCC